MRVFTRRISPSPSRCSAPSEPPRSSVSSQGCRGATEKHQYLRHIPRVSRYLERNLEHPALKPVKDWFDTHLPVALRESAIA